jgi:hypothetical protein
VKTNANSLFNCRTPKTQQQDDFYTAIEDIGGFMDGLDLSLPDLRGEIGPDHDAYNLTWDEQGNLHAWLYIMRDEEQVAAIPILLWLEENHAAIWCESDAPIRIGWSVAAWQKGKLRMAR